MLRMRDISIHFSLKIDYFQLQYRQIFTLLIYKVHQVHGFLFTNSDFIITKSLHPNLADIYNFKLEILFRSRSLSLKYQRFTATGCKGVGIRKFELVERKIWVLSV